MDFITSATTIRVFEKYIYYFWFLP